MDCHGHPGRTATDGSPGTQYTTLPSFSASLRRSSAIWARADRERGASNPCPVRLARGAIYSASFTELSLGVANQVRAGLALCGPGEWHTDSQLITPRAF